MIKYFSKLISYPKWAINVLIREITYPRNRIIKIVSSIRVSISHLFAGKKEISAVLFCYDLFVNPVTFDIVEFIGQAELMRRKYQLKYLDVLIIFDDYDNMIPSHDYTSNAVQQQERIFRIHEIIIGATRLIKSVRNVSLVDRKNASIIVNKYKFRFPDGYHNLLPKSCGFILPKSANIFFPMVEPPLQALKLIQEYLNRFEGKKIVTITLREYGYLPSRNSNIDAWIKFANSISPEFQVVFIPEASSYASPFRKKLDKHEILDSVCWNLALRSALYRLSWLNMGIGGGPLILSLYQEHANTLFFYNPNSYPPDYWLHIQNFYKDEFGKKRKYLRQNNHYVYGEDSFENILTEFENFNRMLSSRSNN